jgi:hypothetical protein
VSVWCAESISKRSSNSMTRELIGILSKLYFGLEISQTKV